MEDTIDENHCDGFLVEGIFTVVIAATAALDAFAAGGLVLLASAVAGLAAGICIGGLIAANFAMLATEEKEKEETVAHSAKRRTRRGITASSATSRSTRIHFYAHAGCRIRNLGLELGNYSAT